MTAEGNWMEPKRAKRWGMPVLVAVAMVALWVGIWLVGYLMGYQEVPS
jgi:hypothetical protein